MRAQHCDHERQATKSGIEMPCVVVGCPAGVKGWHLVMCEDDESAPGGWKWVEYERAGWTEWRRVDCRCGGKAKP